tara:strand:+ start:57210 stop:57812 length:603 start_codon:yes stop_codon:yes gene_type:complete
MKSIKKINSIVLPLNRADVDTDQIMPKQYLKRVERSGYGPFAFDEWRKDPDFVLNDKRFENAEILLAQRNFGSGSSREHAVWGLEDLGIQAVIAPSFADIFNSNCGKVGILCIQLTQKEVDNLMSIAESNDGLTLEIDLADQVLINSKQNIKINFSIDDFLKHRLINGLDDIGITMQREELINKFENDRKDFYPSTKAII